MHYQTLILLVTVVFAFACEVAESQSDPFAETYEQYKEEKLTDRRFKHQDIKELIAGLPDDLFKVEIAGYSIEGREIYHIETGRGNKKVLLWSQMHGNEPTATMALFDIFNFLIHDEGPARNYILENLNLHFIPMLNPDGADAFKRRNALDIDINRDALRLQSPESKVLKTLRDDLNPEWGFNLHDQNRYTSAGKTDEMASISFLAPAFNEEKDWNEGRTNAMQLICKMHQILQNYIPEKIGRYSDEFEPRAFGDNIQKWGTNTILIETGALKDDLEKQFLRKLNYISLLNAFQSIADRSYEDFSLADYEKIPFNQSVLHDLIVRSASLKMFDQNFLFDIGMRQDEIQDKEAENFYLKGYISDLGDLHNYYGYQEFDADGKEIKYEKLYPQTFENLESLRKKGISKLMNQGYTTFIVQASSKPEDLAKLPYRIIQPKDKFIPSTVKIGTNPVLTFWNQGNLSNILVNGHIFAVGEIENSTK